MRNGSEQIIKKERNKSDGKKGKPKKCPAQYMTRKKYQK